MGVFPQIKRVWFSINNRIILWNINKTLEFQTFDEINETILKVEIVKPKPNCFTETITHLLLISTHSDIYILAVSYSETSNDLDLYNINMKIPVNGLNVDKFLSFEPTGQIFFTGENDGLNIWELQYSNSEDWFNKNCSKRCLTRSLVSNMIPGSNILNSVLKLFDDDDNNNNPKNSNYEKIIQLSIDNSRGILYTLSNKSVIRSYKIDHKTGDLSGPSIFHTKQIPYFVNHSKIKKSPLLQGKHLEIVSINVVNKYENEQLYLVAITIGGVRIHLNGNQIGSLRIETIKFPPTKVTKDEVLNQQRKFRENEALNSYNKNEAEMPTILTYQKKSGVLSQSKNLSRIFSPGIFFDVVHKIETNEEKLFVSVPDYGIFKYHFKYIENATFLDCSGKIIEIIPLNEPFNATNKPQGYSNEFATQYLKSFNVAVLTNSSLQIYKYRTPDLIFESLNEDYLSFVSKYGVLEACSTSLYVTCKLNNLKTIRSNAFNFFTLGIPNLIEFKPKYAGIIGDISSGANGIGMSSISKVFNETLSFENVILSPRFYGIVTLLSRLLRDIWDSKVFIKSEEIKFSKNGELIKSSVIDNEYLTKISIDENQLEFFLSSITTLNEFFQTYGNSIACFLSNNYKINNNIDKYEEFANQSENIAINSIIRFIISIKEALSFLIILIKRDTATSDFDNYNEDGDEDDNDDSTNLRDIFKQLPIEVQISLSNLKFKDIFAANDETKDLIKEILSSIINRSMSRGESIEYIAKGLQERCGSFCSTNDVVGFRAIEHLRKAKELGFKNDYEGINYHLTRGIELFEAINNEISSEKLKESIEILTFLNDYPRAIKFVLNISSSIDPGNLAIQFISDGQLVNDERKKFFDRRRDLFKIVFKLLVEIDKLSIESKLKDEEIENNNNNAININNNNSNSNIDFIKLRDQSYEIAFKFEDKFFHYEFYDWFIEQGISEKLLEIETPYILEYLKEKFVNSLTISDLLWIYQSKKGDYYSAALVSYSLALSDFELSLSQRNEYLSRSIGFCNCITLPNQRQQVIELNNLVEEVFEASNIQYDLLILISNDKKISEDKREELIKQLDGKILTISELFNDFADVLSYHEICLIIYKVSDFRNSDEILSRWFKLFESIKKNNKPENFISILSLTVIKIGKKLNNSEFVFPINELFPIILNLVYSEEANSNIGNNDNEIGTGKIVDIFIKSGVSYDKLYFIIRELIENNTNDINLSHYKKEMIYLIKQWYKEDIKLREIVNGDEITRLIEYDLKTDPVYKYISV